MQQSNPEALFSGRTVSVVRDLSVDEQVYLYEKTRRLKSAIQEGGDLSEFRIDRPEDFVRSLITVNFQSREIGSRFSVSSTQQFAM